MRRTTKEKREAALKAIRRFLKNVEQLDNRDPTRLIIDRRFWARGQDGITALSGGNMLLRQDSETGRVGMCCLGFACVQSGVPAVHVIDNGTPEAAAMQYKRAPGMMKILVEKDVDFGGYGDTKLTATLMEVNDAVVGECLDLSGFNLGKENLRDEKHREELITRLFKTAGVKVQFVN